MEKFVFENMDLLDGKIIFNTLWYDEDMPLENQPYPLGEDMFAITYADDAWIIDVGWYNQIGKFILMVVKDQDFDDPFVRIICDDIPIVQKAMAFCLDYVAHELKKICAH